MLKFILSYDAFTEQKLLLRFSCLFFYLRPVWGIVVACICLCVCVRLSVRQSLACPRDNSGPV